MLDPFTGTGTFLVQLLQSDLIHPDDLERKYRSEIHAREILLLAYYIAAVNIEEAFRGQRGGDSGYEPFKRIILADTFNMNKLERTLFDHLWENNELTKHQQKLPIEVIIGNPPWSVGQRRVSDLNPNVDYPELEQRVRETYAAKVGTRNLNSLYDTYKMAIRWASDKVESTGQGVIAFVTPATWITGITDTGIRASLPDEFSSIYVLNLRGDARASRSQSQLEGEGVFKNATRSPVAITILVKNPNATHNGCEIHYRHIGDSLKREEKFKALNEAKSIYGFNDWEVITPDRHNDWIQQRSEEFSRFFPLGTKEMKEKNIDDAIFKLYSRGIATRQDSYIYNFSHSACSENAQRMIDDYLAAIAELEEDPKLRVNEAAQRHSQNIIYGDTLSRNLRRKVPAQFYEGYIRKAAYRPFVKMYCYADKNFIQRRYQMHRIFPENNSVNRVICVPGIGSKNPFSVLMTDTVPDLGFNNACQCFPRYRYYQSVIPYTY